MLTVIPVSARRKAARTAPLPRGSGTTATARRSSPPRAARPKPLLSSVAVRDKRQFVFVGVRVTGKFYEPRGKSNDLCFQLMDPRVRGGVEDRRFVFI